MIAQHVFQDQSSSVVNLVGRKVQLLQV